MRRPTVNLLLDEELVRSVRQMAVGAVGKSDAEVIEDALSGYLHARMLEISRAGSRAASPFDPDQPEHGEVQDIRAKRRPH